MNVVLSHWVGSRRLLLLIGVLVTALVSLSSVAYAGDDQGAPTYYSSGLAATPYMGWNTYYGLGAPTESAVKSVADNLVSSGLSAAGYKYVWLDGGWQGSPPRVGGNLVADATKFPSGIPALAAYVHGLGLKIGIYTDAGTYDPAHCGLGSGGYYTADANQFASWAIDAVKVDFLCAINQNLDPATVYKQFSAAIAASGRPMLFNLCDPVTSAWAVPHTPQQEAGYAYSYGPVTGDSWRTDTDIAFGTPYATGEWAYVLRAMDANAAHPEANGPGHYNDPDYLLPMRPVSGGGYELSQEESTSQLVMWAEMASPLIIGSDPRTLSPAMLATMTNPEVIGVDQDPLAIQGVRVATSSTGDVYSKVLSGTGQRSVVLLNRSNAAASMTVTFANAGLNGTVAVRDLRGRVERGSFSTSYTTTVPSHGTAMLKLSGTNLVAGPSLGGGATASPALVRVTDTNASAFVRGADGALWLNTLAGSTWPTTWTSLGGPVAGQILGQPAAYGSSGGRLDVFVRGTDNGAYQRTFSGGSWGPWVALGGTITDAPTVAFTSPTTWTLFARASDGQIWLRTASSGIWSGIGAPNGKPTYGRPSAVTDANGTYVAVRTADDHVWWRTKNTSGVWGNWIDLGGVVSGSPTLLATGGGIYMFARTSDYTLWQRTYSTSTSSWNSWAKRGEYASNSFYGALGAANGAAGTVWAAVRGVDGNVHQTVL